MSKPKLCFNCICKNESKCILETLNSIYKYIDYWVICDTGSTDNTRELITQFFNEKNIPGELYQDEWQGFDHNFTLMLEKTYNKSDFFIHFDADDLFDGNINKDKLDNNVLKYNSQWRRGSASYEYPVIYNNTVKWVAAGCAHTVYIPIDAPSNLREVEQLTSFIIESRGVGDRANDSEKFTKDALNLKQQFFDTLEHDPYNLNRRSAFYTAQSYKDAGNYQEAIKWYVLYNKLSDAWDEEQFEAHLSLMYCKIILKYEVNDIINEYNNCIAIFDDRAEPYIDMANYYFDKGNYELSYYNLKIAQTMDFNQVKQKYILFVRIDSYGKPIKEFLRKICILTNRNEEAIQLQC